MTSDTGMTTPLKQNKVNEIMIKDGNTYINMLSSMHNIILIIIKNIIK